MLTRLKMRLGSLASLFEDEELTDFIDTAVTGYNLTEGEDDALILDLALATCYLRLATDTGMYFKYTQADESVDKSMTPKTFRELYETLWDSCRARLPEDLQVQPSDTFIMRKDESETTEDES